jgi:single-stranded-DNA-specific exonuclease
MPASNRPTRSEAAFLKLLDDLRRTPAGAAPAAAATPFIEELFRKGAEYAKRDPYATIGEASAFNTKVVGVTFEGRQDLVAGLRAGDRLTLVRRPENPHDANAIAVCYGDLQIGFIHKAGARRLAPKIDEGIRYSAEVTSVTGGGSRTRGVNIRVVRLGEAAVTRVAPAARTAARDDIRHALIGDRPIRDAQLEVLARLDHGRNTLVVMGTGRGKSFCYQYPAATQALEDGRKTLVIYPLRALANDQHDALMRRLEPLGLRIHLANGSIGDEQRSSLMAALDTGAWDVICSTPEFVQYHLERFALEQNRPNLLVIDEAHHLFESTHRAAYGGLGRSLSELGNPQILALTATAGEQSFAHIRAALGIDAWVIDATIRTNLRVVDARETKDREGYIERIVREPGKAIVYCNSRSGATKVAERLRRTLGDEVAFYHAGIPGADRSIVESMFREGALRVIVATSAFGEGIDLPDVRNVFLYHLNFSFTDFNQQAGRAGRDGTDAAIHLLYGEADRRINDYIIAKEAPALGTLRDVYREMKKMANDGELRMNNADIASVIDNDLVDGTTIGVALRIFEDAGLVAVGRDDDGRLVTFNDVRERIDLTKNERFAEGQADRESFDRFCSLALTAKAQTLETIVNRPIYPEQVPLLSSLAS